MLELDFDSTALLMAVLKMAYDWMIVVDHDKLLRMYFKMAL